MPVWRKWQSRRSQKPLIVISCRFESYHGHQRKVLNIDKQDFKKSKEELQDYLSFRRRGSKVAPKKGKGSFKRKEKHKEDLRD